MWPHFKNLLGESYELALAKGSSTGISVWLLGFGVLALAFAFTVFVEWLRGGRSMNALRMALKSWTSFIGAALGLFAAWIILYGWSLVSTVYRDHVSLVAASAKTCLGQEKKASTAPTPLHQQPQKPPISFQIKQHDKGTANPGVVTGPTALGPCAVLQNGGSNNTASPNCVPPQRTLSAENYKKFVDAVRPFCPFQVAVRPIPGNQESMQYADQIVKALKAAGCVPQNPRFLIDTAASYGVMIAVNDSAPTPTGAEPLAEAFNAANVPWKRLPASPIEPGVAYVMVGLDDPKPQP